MFPILIDYRGTKWPCPSAIPWEAIAPYDGQARVNHQQSLERLAERGGLSPVEAFLVMSGRTWHDIKFTDELQREACAFLDKLVRDREQLQADHDHYKGALQMISETSSNDPERIKKYAATMLKRLEGAQREGLT